MSMNLGVFVQIISRENRYCQGDATGLYHGQGNDIKKDTLYSGVQTNPFSFSILF